MNIVLLPVHIRHEVFGKKCFKYTRQVCCSTRINRLLDLEQSIFNLILVLHREIEKQDSMFKVSWFKAKIYSNVLFAY